jgi:SAM-dependent methyltransferase
MAHPLCRRAINRRVSGSPDEWPLDWFKRVHAPIPFARGVSWGCGLGAFERAAVRAGIVQEIDAFDVSVRSLEAARASARAEGFESIHYARGDFDDPQLPPGRYDIAFFHASLHHVSKLERLFSRLRLALKPAGAIYLDEYIGPSRNRWTDRRLRVARALLDLLPAEARRQDSLPPPIEADDPSEAVRSEEIPFFFESHFETIAWRPYGGQIADLLIPCLRPEWIGSEPGERTIGALLTIEDREIASDPSLSHHAVAYGRLKSDSRAGLFRRLFSPGSR